MADALPIPTHSQFQDLTGQRFTRWQVEGYAGQRGPHHYWNCICDCGVQKSVAKNSLTAKKSLSCGCLKNEQLAFRRLINLEGKKFGRLFVLARYPSAEASIFPLSGGEALRLSIATWAADRLKNIRSIAIQTMTDHMLLGIADGRRNRNKPTTVAQKLNNWFQKTIVYEMVV